MSETEVKKEEAAPTAEKPSGGVTESRGPRRGRGGDKTCYNCGKVSEDSRFALLSRSRLYSELSEL